MSEVPWQGSTIAIIDDDAVSLRILGNGLGDDYRLVVATSGEDAIKVTATARPDLILLDVLMPGMDGYEVCRRIKEIPGHADTPIIFITSLSHEQDELKGFLCGAVDYITKPFSMERVRARVSLHLERKHSRDQLLEALEENKLILETIGEGIYGVDANGLITFVNPVALQLTGFTAEELVGRNQHDLLHCGHGGDETGEAVACPVIETSVDGHSRCLLGDLFWRKDGSRFPVEYVVAPAPATAALAAVVVFRDVSRRLEAERERLKTQKLHAIGALAAGLAHDFNNLLTAVIGNIDIGMNCLEAGSPGVPFFRQAKEVSFKAARLTQKLISLAEGGGPIKTELDLGRLLTEAIASAGADGEVTYRFQVSLPDSLWPLYADQVQLGQAIQNVLINAREAMPDGGEITITAGNALSGRQENPALEDRPYVWVAVADRGMGIPAETMPQIFDPYFSTKQRGPQKGMGLGLTLCHSIMVRHDGLITVASKPGEGTVVRLYLPSYLAETPGDRRGLVDR